MGRAAQMSSRSLAALGSSEPWRAGSRTGQPRWLDGHRSRFGPGGDWTPRIEGSIERPSVRRCPTRPWVPSLLLTDQAGGVTACALERSRPWTRGVSVEASQNAAEPTSQMTSVKVHQPRLVAAASWTSGSVKLDRLGGGAPRSYAFPLGSPPTAHGDRPCRGGACCARRTLCRAAESRRGARRRVMEGAAALDARYATVRTLAVAIPSSEYTTSAVQISA